ncbi:SAC3 domain-containing protein 1 isoform X1 [Drosophila gunungcola]|uniref:SAC3 domain-containing protein 1 isoform X1 n=1 Tax=Drosophila gunungcola TaxID=103775 RepID=UPI0022E72B31|nr:SAC3 domain-containing protein 1 isoform X1 [Drosophila gunungcola]
MAQVRGSCERFCPDGEAKMRIREKLLHYFELKNGQKNTPGVLVKEFTRSAADAKMPLPQEMRTEAALTKTVEYLLKDIILDTRKPFNLAYDFIFDRLRAVRREIVIQMYDARQKIRLLEPIVMFLAYSRYRLCEESIEKFDPKICNQHLQECLTGVLCCYDELEGQASSKEPTIRELERRCYIESLYQVFNLGSPESFARALTLPDFVRQDSIFKLCFAICLAFQQRNLYRVLMGFPQLPHILCSVAATKLQAIRRSLLQVFTHAYNNKQLTVPVPYLLRLLLIDSPAGLQDQCRHYNISFTGDRKAVQFNKTDFNQTAELLKTQHERFVESKLKRIYLPEVLLLKKLN